MRSAFLTLLSLAAMPATPSRLLLNSDGRNESVAAVGRLRINSTCTAFLIQPVASAAAPVYALTNGHCVLGASDNRVALDTPVPTNSSLTLHYFADTPSRRQEFPIRTLPYATLKGLDIAIVEIDATWAALTAAGIRPVPVAAEPPRLGTEVYTVGAPINGVPAAEAWLRRSNCAIDAVAQLAEGPWKFHDAIRLACGSIFGGASGSPVFDATTNQAVAIINTSTQGLSHTTGDIPCFMNSPCELTGSKGNLIRESAYALPLAGILSCFDGEGRFALRNSSCELDPGGGVALSNLPFPSVRPGAEWNAGVAGEGFTHYRYKTGPEFETDCRVEAGYSEPIPLTAGAVIREPIPAADGLYVLCAAGNGQNVRHATFAHTKVDTTPPALQPQWSVRGDPDAYFVQFFFDVPDLSDYRYKFGPDPATDCDNPAGYLVYRRVPIRVPASTAPLVRFCVIGGDRADNFTRPTHILLGQNHPLPSGVVNSAGFRQGPLSPGAWGSIFFATDIERAPPLLSLRDAAGTEHPIPFPPRSIAGNQINFIVPLAAAIGDATLRIASPLPASVLLSIRPVSPGIFTGPDQLAWGGATVADGSYTIGPCGTVDCPPVRLPATVRLFMNGLRFAGTGPARFWLAGEELTGRVSAGGAEVDIPAGFPYRGFVTVQVEYGGVRSNVAYLYLKDEGI